MEIRKALAVIRRSKTSRKQVSVKWVVGQDSNFSGLVFGLLTFLANLLLNMQLTLDSCENGGPPPLPFSGGEERSPNPKTGGEERGLLLPSRFQHWE